MCFVANIDKKYLLGQTEKYPSHTGNLASMVKQSDSIRAYPGKERDMLLKQCRVNHTASMPLS